jgi:hypothetical protein
VICALDVILIYDRTTNPAKWKMAVCVQPDCLIFLRINSSSRWKPAVPLNKEPHHPKLDHDSFIECNLPLELTEYEVEQSLKTRGVLFRLHGSLTGEINAEIQNNTSINEDDKKAIAIALIGGKAP